MNNRYVWLTRAFLVPIILICSLLAAMPYLTDYEAKAVMASLGLIILGMIACRVRF